MKRTYFLFCVLIFLGLGSLRADEAVRAAQDRLKEMGFYFGEANGVYSSATAAAVSRFQIRQGLQITGQLDAGTAKSLGVAAPSGASSPAPSEAETWRRLRRADEQFLTKLNAGEIPPPSEPAHAATAPPRKVVTTTEEGRRLLVLSRERLRDYVAAFVLAGLDGKVGAELEFFADKVRYFDDGLIAREKIRGDLRAYNQRWPDRRFWLAGEVKVEPEAESRLRVTFPLRFELRNGRKRASGEVMKTLIVEVVGEDLEIVSVNERNRS